MEQTFDFTGDSWFASNVREYNRRLWISQGHKQAGQALHSLAAEGFGAASWHAGGNLTARPTFANYLDRFGEAALSDARAGRGRLLLDMSNEGKAFSRTADYIDAVHADLKRAEIPADRLILLTQNTRYDQAYREHASGRHEALIRIVNYDYCPIRMARLSASAMVEENQDPAPRPYRYNCLNYSARDHRVGMVAWLYGAGFADQGLISFRRIERLGAGGYMEAIRPPTWFPEPGVVRDGAARLDGLGHLTVDLRLADLEGASAASPDFALPNASIYRQSYFTIVTEGDLSDGDLLRFTEKSIKPIACSSPFIVLGNPRTLAALRGLGFRTFAPAVDETYDTIHDPVRRTAAVLSELRHILTLSDADIIAWRRTVQSVVQFNLAHLRGNLQTTLDRVEVEVTRKLVD